MTHLRNLLAIGELRAFTTAWPSVIAHPRSGNDHVAMLARVVLSQPNDVRVVANATMSKPMKSLGVDDGCDAGILCGAQLGIALI